MQYTNGQSGNHGRVNAREVCEDPYGYAGKLEIILHHRPDPFFVLCRKPCGHMQANNELKLDIERWTFLFRLKQGSHAIAPHPSIWLQLFGDPVLADQLKAGVKENL